MALTGWCALTYQLLGYLFFMIVLDVAEIIEMNR